MGPSPPDEDDDLDDLLDDEPRSRAPDSGAGRRSRRSRSSRAEPVRRWSGAAGAEDPWDEVVDDRPGARPRSKAPVFWRARDSLYFEPLVALAILAVLLVSLFAYTSNWPPVYVVESNSMQHGSGDHLGVLNAGDIVLAQRVSNSSIVTYVAGISSGFTTYGEYGDVLLYYPNGSSSATPIVHRALLFLQFNKANDTFNTTNLPANRCGTGNNSVWDVPGSPRGCQTQGLSNLLYLYHIGQKDLTITVDFARLLATGSTHSGYLTLGDNNSDPDQLSAGATGPLSTLVEPAWVIGVARGMIPWFGALKLLLDGNAGKVPDASWEFLGLTVAGVIFAAAGVHLLLRRGREARAAEREADAAFDEERPPPTPRRSAPPRTAVQPWQATAVDETEEAPPGPRRMSYEQRRRAHFTSSREQQRARRRRPTPPPDDEKDDS